MVGTQRKTRDDIGDALGTQDRLVSLVYGHIAQGCGSCSNHQIMPIVEKFSN